MLIAGTGTCGRPLRRSGSARAGGFSPAALALFTRFTTPPSAARKVLINNLIVALQSVWTKYDCFYMCAAADTQAAQRNWIADTFNLTEVNSPAFVADQGYTGNGTTSYCETGFDPTIAPGAKFTQNNAYMGAWHRTDLANAGATSFDNGNINSRFANDASLITNPRPNFGGTITITENYAKDKAWSRTASNAWRYYNSGVLIGSDPRTDASVALTAAAFRMGSTSAAGFGVNQCSVFRFGSSLTTAEQAAEFAAIQAYMTAVGAG